MTMADLLITNARVLTMLAPGETRPPERGRRGGGMRTLGVFEMADVLIAGGQIRRVVPCGSDPVAELIARGVRAIDAAGRVLMPGFVDCHTHACWAGSRIDEWERKLAGASYQEIAAAGGGIMSTVRATRAADETTLSKNLSANIERMVRLGTTTLEVKSGYGLTLEHEMKMLRVISGVRPTSGATVVPTALLGHAIDAEIGHERFVRETIEQTLPAVLAAYPGIAVDAFCETGAWSVDECVRLVQAMWQLSGSWGPSPFRVHTDQFTSLGMTETAVSGLLARSVDHLEACDLRVLMLIAATETFAVGLPVCGFHLDGRYAKLGFVVERGGKVCIATNLNPGSAPCPSMPMAIALAVRHCGLTAAEAIVAATVNPACLLGLPDRGYIAPGARADCVLLRHTDERALAYEVGGNPVDVVIVGGCVVE